MTDIHVDPDLLAQQSAQMANLMQNYQSLFMNVTKVLNAVNSLWSPNMSNNFGGKITAAQKTFETVVSMLSHGSSAAKFASSTFSGDIGAAMDACFGDSAVSGWLQENAAGLDPQASSFIMGLIESGTVDAKTLLSVCQQVKNGDYNGALSLVADKGIDWIADNLSGGIPEGSLVEKLNDATGGALGLATIEKDFYKNWIKEPLKNAIDAYQLNNSGDYSGALKELGKMAWNSTGGAVIKTCGDAAFDVAKNIPGIGEYYANQGATDFEGALGVMIKDVNYMVTGDAEYAASVGNYYKDHGGIADGVVDGLVEIGKFLGEKMGNIGWHSKLG